MNKANFAEKAQLNGAEQAQIVDLLAFRMKKANAPVVEALRIMQAVREVELAAVPMVAPMPEKNSKVEVVGENKAVGQGGDAQNQATEPSLDVLGHDAQRKISTLKRMAKITQDSFYQKWLSVESIEPMQLRSVKSI